MPSTAICSWRMSFLALLVIVAPVFLIIVAGYVVRRAEWLTAEADASLLRLGVNLLFPCLILDTILGNSALASAELPRIVSRIRQGKSKFTPRRSSDASASAVSHSARRTT